MMGKAKKYLIFLFLALNIFLFAQLFFLSENENSLNPESVQKTIDLLSQNHIAVDEKLLPDRVEVLDYLELYNPLSDIQAFSSQMHTSNISTKENTFSIPLSLPLSNDSEKDILKALNSVGFKPYNLSFYDAMKNDITGEQKLLFYQTYNHYPILGASVSATVSKNHLTNAEGTLYNILNVKLTDSSNVSPLQVLLTISASYSGNQTKSLTSFSQAYYVDAHSSSYVNLTAIPCYVVRFDQSVFYYDSLSGMFLSYSDENHTIYTDENEAFVLFSSK